MFEQSILRLRRLRALGVMPEEEAASAIEALLALNVEPGQPIIEVAGAVGLGQEPERPEPEPGQPPQTLHIRKCSFSPFVIIFY